MVNRVFGQPGAIEALAASPPPQHPLGVLGEQIRLQIHLLAGPQVLQGGLLPGVGDHGQPEAHPVGAAPRHGEADAVYRHRSLRHDVAGDCPVGADGYPGSVFLLPVVGDGAGAEASKAILFR